MGFWPIFYIIAGYLIIALMFKQNVTVGVEVKPVFKAVELFCTRLKGIFYKEYFL